VIVLTATPTISAAEPLKLNHVEMAFKVIGAVWPPGKKYFDQAKPFLQAFGILEAGPKSDQAQMLEALQKIDATMQDFAKSFDTFALDYNKDRAAEKKENILADVTTLHRQSRTYTDAVRRTDGDLDKYLAKYAMDTTTRDNNVVIGILGQKGLDPIIAIAEKLSTEENLKHLQDLLQRTILGPRDKDNVKGVNRIDTNNAYNAALLHYDVMLQAALEQAFEIERLALYLHYRSPNNEAYGHLLAVGETFGTEAGGYDAYVEALRKTFNDREDMVNNMLVAKATDFATVLPNYASYRDKCDVTYYDGHELTSACVDDAGTRQASYTVKDIPSICGSSAGWTVWNGYLQCRGPLRDTFAGGLASSGYVPMRDGTVERSGMSGNGPYLGFDLMSRSGSPADLVPAANSAGLELKVGEKYKHYRTVITVETTPYDWIGGKPKKIEQGALFAIVVAGRAGDASAHVSLACVVSSCSLGNQESYASTLDFVSDLHIRLDKCGDSANGGTRMCIYVRKKGWPGYSWMPK